MIVSCCGPGTLELTPDGHPAPVGAAGFVNPGGLVLVSQYATPVMLAVY